MKAPAYCGFIGPTDKFVEILCGPPQHDAHVRSFHRAQWLLCAEKASKELSEYVDNVMLPSMRLARLREQQLGRNPSRLDDPDYLDGDYAAVGSRQAYEWGE